MSMTKKHYLLIADAFAMALEDCDDQLARDIAVGYLQPVAQRMSVFMKQDNPNFDRARFLKACGVGE